MSFRFNENDVATSGADKILVLDNTGKIPALDGSNITGLISSKANGRNYTYTLNNTTSIDASIDTFYYIPQANTKASLGGATVNINLSYSSNIINGSKIGFEFISTSSPINGGSYTITTPANASLAAQGWTSFELWIDGASYSNGAVFSSDAGANRNREFYAYVSGTDLKWFEMRGGIQNLSECKNFDINSTNTFATGRNYLLATKFDSSYSSASGNVNVLSTCSPKAVNVSLASGFTANLGTNMPSMYRQFFITNSHTTGSTNWGTFTLPAASTSTGILWQFHMGASVGSDSGTWADMTIASPANFRWNYAISAFSQFLAAQGTSTSKSIMIVSDGTAYYAGNFNFFGY